MCSIFFIIISARNHGPVFNTPRTTFPRILGCKQEHAASIMAAPVGKMRRVSDESSSSDEEALRRCQEAVWETKPVRQKGDNGSVRVVERRGANMAAGAGESPGERR